jgi:hypothetical protein
MSDDQNQNSDDTNESAESTKPDELAMLKQRARMMGITFSNAIGIETLRAKIEEKMSGKTETATAAAPELQDPATPVAAKKLTLRQQIQRENMKLIRLRITNMDPKKKDLPGEVFTVANSYLGTVRKFVPYGEVTENGYHVPYCIYKMMKRRKFLNIRTYKDRNNHNQIKIEQNWAQEFALEVLPPLTKQELAQLATAQAAAGSVS